MTAKGHQRSRRVLFKNFILVSKSAKVILCHSIDKSWAVALAYTMFVEMTALIGYLGNNTIYRAFTVLFVHPAA